MDDTRAERSHRGADGDLFAAREGAGEEKIGDVGAGDEEDERDGAEHHKQGGTNIADGLITEGMNDGAPSFVLGGVGLFEALGDGVHLGLRLLDGDSGFEAADGEVVMVVANGRGGGSEGHGNPYSGEAGLVHRRAHDADDSVGVAVEVDGFADGSGIVGVMSLPEFVAEDDLAVLAWVVFVRAEDAAVDGFDSEGREEVCADGAGGDGFGFACAGDVKACSGVDGHLVEEAGLLLPVEEVGGGDGEGRHAGKAGLGRRVPYLHDAVGVAIGKGLEENFVNDAEDGGVCPDAQGHDEGRGQSKARVFYEKSKRVSKVLQE